ncbi:AAA family ATPase [Rhodoferax sp.]|uniref:AAA family ATPase n=1 Tax=Rhodoferax sp. TaxID=50421 RepID=UPI002625BAAD|nr:AAA family ATPase [Rhodoferax sp.]MDD3937579.1 AAA family ATPase [Rhodoferax sp.]
MENPDTDPPGFALYRLYQDDYSRRHDMFVPSHLKDDLEAESKRRFKEKEAEQDKLIALEKAQAREEAISSSKASASTDSGTDNNSFKSKEQIELEKETQAWAGIDESDRTRSSRHRYPVFKSEQALALRKRLSKSDGDERARLDQTYQELVQAGTTLREIARPKSLKSMETLAEKQPHMKEVVHFVMAQINMARRSQKPVRLQPMLLVGEAGVGKTHFAQALAQALSTTIHIQALDSDLTSSVFLGSDRKWGNSQHGVLFETVVLGRHANPIIVLDEIDKPSRSMSYASPVSSLYSVLEPVSAKGVRDISLMFEFDASQVTWIATANTAMYLDPPLRSRFREFHIMPPTAAECLVLAEEVMRASIESLGIKGFKPDVSLRRHLAHLPARQISQLTLEAVANAVAADRKELRQVDFPRWLFEDEARGQGGKVRQYLH